MNERVEIEVIACCPKCGHSFSDWILLDVDCLFLLEEFCKESKEMGGEFDEE